MPPIVNRAKGIGECLLAVEATIALATRTCNTLVYRSYRDCIGDKALLLRTGMIFFTCIISIPRFPDARPKKQKRCLPEELEAGDCWIALSLAQLSGLVLCGRVGKHTDSLAIELVTSTEGKTDCKEWTTDGWQAYGRVLPNEVDHYISKALTQRLERTNSTLRQQTGRWH